MAPVAFRSGGQSGVDRAALVVAQRRGAPYLGWCPRGGWAEDYPRPPGILQVFPRMCETPSRDPRQRTAWNVRDSHATLILTPEGKIRNSPGTAFALLMAQLVYRRPVLVAGLNRRRAAQMAAEWFQGVGQELGEGEIVLNVAGPRESSHPGIQRKAEGFLERFLDHCRQLF